MHTTPTQLIDFSLDYAGDQPLYRQVYLRYRDAILHGNLPPGARVPSIRTLASELHLSRNTVEKAYDLLIGEGFLAGNNQAGTTVASLAAQHRWRPAAPAVHDQAFAEPAAVAVAQPRPFQLGTPALDAFPLAAWNLLSHRLARDRLSMHSPPDVQGYGGLRRAIAAYLQVSRGVACVDSQVFVTSGYRQSLGLLASALLRPGDPVWVEDPAYPPALRVLGRAGLRVVPVPVDGAGMQVAAGRAAAPRARMALVTPANQSPLGMVMSLPRRADLLAWAAEAEAWLVEDDYDSEFCAEGRRLPTLTSLDRAERAIYLGTFSKALHPALRVAYMVVPPRLVPPLRAIYQDLVDGGPVPVHRTLATFMADGHFGRHLKRMRGIYARRREALVAELASRLGDRLSVAPWARGLSVLARLRPGLDDQSIAARAQAAGLAPGALSARGIHRSPGQGLLLGFANFPDAGAVARAVDQLARCF
ncbi:MAG: PLP-dependent aminotransferase family protein [Xenophilus sp.]